jgi:16S rRNA (cytosine967-C5)-methyltransferase
LEKTHNPGHHKPPLSTRLLAVTALGRIGEKSLKPKDVLDELSATLDTRERSFLMELVYGVLRQRDYLDWILKNYIKKISGLSPATRDNLRMALYQLRHMRSPEFAVVNEAVEIEKRLKGKPSLVNAVLRNILRQKGEPFPLPSDPLERLSISQSHPKWLIERWVRRLGYEGAKALAEKNNEIPPLTIRLRNDEERQAALSLLREKGVAAQPTASSPSGIIIEDIRSFQEISKLLPCPYMVQDEAAQLVTYLLDPLPGERILDACAAPGGKTAHIAALMEDRGEIIALEPEAKRISLMQENLERMGISSVTVVQEDARTPRLEGGFDRILIDAPCSSLGVIRRNPDIRYRQASKDLLRFREKQLEILRSLAPLLREGGIMVYSVCSTEPEEGEEVIAAFLQDHSDFIIIEGRQEFLSPFRLPDQGQPFYRTFPQRDEMDGFFAARLQKKEKR